MAGGLNRAMGTAEYADEDKRRGRLMTRARREEDTREEEEEEGGIPWCEIQGDAMRGRDFQSLA
eukprot:746686-Hanusia_phi.AAC.3